MTYFKKVNRVVNVKDLNALTVREMLESQVLYVPDVPEDFDSESQLIMARETMVRIKQGEDGKERGFRLSVVNDVEFENDSVKLGDAENCYFQTSVKLVDSALPIYKSIYELQGLTFPSVTTIFDLTYEDVEILNNFGNMLNSDSHHRAMGVTSI